MIGKPLRRGQSLAGAAEVPGLVLDDGRFMAYGEYGLPDGRPVLYCHGFPASRLEARLAHETAWTLGLRIIAPDRPGYGASDFRPGRTLSDWTRDAAMLLDRLELTRVAVLGVSGGAPYALACGARLGARVRRLGIVCGLGAMQGPETLRELAPAPRVLADFAHRMPRLARLVYGGVLGRLLGRSPRTALAILTQRAPLADRRVLADPTVAGVVMDAFREAFRQGGRGAAWDLTLFTRPWDFELDQVRVPGDLWHGEADTTVPVSMGRRHAAAMPQLETHWFAQEGHFSLPVRHMGSILAALQG